MYSYFSIPTLTVTQDEGHIELELSDDPFDVQRLDVTHAPCIVTLSKVRVSSLEFSTICTDFSTIPSARMI